MKKLAISILAVAAGISTALVAGKFLTAGTQPTISRAQWKNIYRTPGGLVAGADLIVVADHLYAEPGRVVGETEDALPFTDNTFAVNNVLRGDLEGGMVVVEQTGGLMANGQLFNIDDGGLYEPGSTYLLFLRANGDGKYHLINYQARYRVVDGVLEGIDPTDQVVAQFHNRSLDGGRKMVEKRARLIE